MVHGELFVTSGLTSRGSIQIAPYENNFISQLRLMDGVDLDCSFLTIRNWGSLIMSDSVVTLGSKLRLFGGRAVLEGHGTLNREGVPFGAFVSNGGVINLTGELVVDGRYDQYITEDDVVTNGLVSVSTDDLDEGANLAVQGVANLAGAMEFSAGIEPPGNGYDLHRHHRDHRNSMDQPRITQSPPDSMMVVSSPLPPVRTSPGEVKAWWPRYRALRIFCCPMKAVPPLRPRLKT